MMFYALFFWGKKNDVSNDTNKNCKPEYIAIKEYTYMYIHHTYKHICIYIERETERKKKKREKSTKYKIRLLMNFYTRVTYAAKIDNRTYLQVLPHKQIEMHFPTSFSICSLVLLVMHLFREILARLSCV